MYREVTSADQENVPEYSTVHTRMHSNNDEIQSLSRQLGSTNQTDTHLGCQQRKMVSNLPAFQRNVDACLLEVNSNTSYDCENVIHKRSKRVKTTIESLKQHLTSTVYKNFELDVLLTPLSESSRVRPHHPVANVRLSPVNADFAASPESTGSTPAGLKISKPCASVLPHISTNSEWLKDRVEMDVIEKTVPKSLDISRTCSLIPVQVLSRNNAFATDDTEMDVFVRSFWDEDSDRESQPPNRIVDFDDQEVSVDCRVRGRLKKTGAAWKQKKIVATSTVTKNSKQHRSKPESNCYKSSRRNQKGTKADDNIVLRSCGMTLRPRRKAEVDCAGRKASFSCRRQLTSQKTKKSPYSHKEKSESFITKRKTSKNNKKPSQKVHTEMVPVDASGKAARKRSRIYSRSTPPSLSSRANDRHGQLCCQMRRGYRANQKCAESSHKHILSDAATKPPAKKQKLCKKGSANEVSHPYEEQAKDNAAVRRSSRLQARQPKSDQRITDCVTSKQSQTSRSTSRKKSRSLKQSVKKCVIDQLESTPRVILERLTENRENVDTTATKTLQCDEIKGVGDAGSSLSVIGKKSRCVDISLLFIFLI